MKKKFACSVLYLGGVVCLCANTWTGAAGDSLWLNADNWDDFALPSGDVGLDAGTMEEPIVVGAMEDPLPITSLSIAGGEGSAGVLRMDEGGSLKIGNTLQIGSAGNGVFWMNGGALTVQKPIQVGIDFGSEGLFLLQSGTVLASNNLEIASSGTGTYRQEGGTIEFADSAGQTHMLEMGEKAGSLGRFYVSGGTFDSSVTAFHAYAGRAGSAEIVISGDAKVVFSRQLRAAELEGSTCKMDVLDTSKLSFSRESYIGISGTAELNLQSDVSLSRGFVLGHKETGFGRIEAGDVTISCTSGDSPEIKASMVGNAGAGELLLRGTTIKLAKKGFWVRAQESGSGVVRGYGSIENSGKASDFPVRILLVNGHVIADGYSEPHDLVFNNNFCCVSNSIENTGDCGWYAQAGGRLVLPTLNVPAGACAINWGEDPSDEEIDLVNSVRIAFGEDSAGGNLDGKLFAIDRDDFPQALPAGDCLSVWSFTESDALIPEQIEFVLPAEKALGKILSIRLCNTQTEGWDALPVVAQSGNRIAVQTARLGTFAAFAAEPGMVMIFR
ncbi:MAG: hypothetical protein ACI4QT_03660 [Kiritimatiellia bacterium]